MRQGRSFFDVETLCFSGRGDSYLFIFDGARTNHLFDGLGSFNMSGCLGYRPCRLAEAIVSIQMERIMS